MRKQKRQINITELKYDASNLLSLLFSLFQKGKPKDYEILQDKVLIPALIDFLEYRNTAEKEREKARREHRKAELELLKKGQKYFEEMKELFEVTE